MSKLTKNIIGIILLCALITPPVVTICWLQHQKVIVKEQVKKQLLSGIEKKELVQLKFTKVESQTELDWEHDREFEYQGEMYDVVETTIKEDSVYYLCWWDHAETQLKKQLKNLVAQMLGQDAQNTERHKRLFDFYKTLYCNDLPTVQDFHYLHNGSLNPYLSNYISLTLSPPVPPPRFC